MNPVDKPESLGEPAAPSFLYCISTTEQSRCLDDQPSLNDCAIKEADPFRDR